MSDSSTPSTPSTPLMRQYSAIKKQHPTALLFFRLGEFYELSGEDAEARILEELNQLRPRELLYPSTLPLFDRAAGAKPNATQSSPERQFSFSETPLDDWAFAPDYAIPLLENQFGVLSLEGFGLAGRKSAASAAGAILHYVRSTQRGTLSHLDRLGFYDRQDCLVLDAVTVRNLELVEAIFPSGGAEVTLFRAIDATLTPMGKRLLRSWILRPSIERAQIEARLDAVEANFVATIAREELRRSLDGVLDLERLLSRITLE